jgi:hypothetical protein
MVCSHRDIASDIGLRAHPCEETDMPFYEKGDVRIRYEEAGSGFPLLLIPGGGLNSTISFFNGNAPVEEERIIANPAPVWGNSLRGHAPRWRSSRRRS